MVSRTYIDYFGELSDNSPDNTLDKVGFIEKYMNKKIFVFDYDHTIKLHNLSSDIQTLYENNLYNILYKLKTQYNKKIYLVSYNLRPKFNNEYMKLFEEMYIPLPKQKKEFEYLQKKFYCKYTLWCGNFYRYIPKHLHIKKIADKNNIHLSNVVFFDDNLKQITNAKLIGVDAVLVDPYKGIEL